MSAAALSTGNHNFVVSTVPVAGGGWTITIVHRHFTDDEVVEARHDSDIVYVSEELALKSGREIIRLMAEKYSN